ncbi:hypothetical protein J2W23_002645 [Variovorax boronicumulans]|uniref:DUF3613 domain-containing protein n=1 Tax=Variovorax boronicumulans TaxID=436515 RepID=UPI00277FD7CD|nr:DUF3613 domain-containing protein [Variovorax boronicumulans]MDQ0014254.1 hypothetical protein [Variovorax boronicumulans]
MKQTSTRRTAALELTLFLALLATGSVAVAQETVAKPASPDARSGTNEVRAEAPKKPADAPGATPLPTDPTAGDMAQAEAEADYVYEVETEPLQVGDATQGLLAWQRSGEIASPTPRPIAGSVANRSYERYLKSFEFPIPERMSSIVKTTSDGGSGK